MCVCEVGVLTLAERGLSVLCVAFGSQPKTISFLLFFSMKLNEFKS